jgi:hypothetical protein
MIAALAAALLLFTSAPAGSAVKSESADTSDKVQILAVDQSSPSSITYAVKLTDYQGNDVCGADLDLGALTDNPDFRVNTGKLVEQSASQAGGAGCQYVRTIQYPASGDFVLVVRVHEPRQFVHLGRELITDKALPSSGDHIDTPSRQALRSIAPNFAATYDPMTGIGSNQGIGSKQGSNGGPSQQAVAANVDHGHVDGSPTAAAVEASGRIRQTNLLWASLASLLALYAVVRLWSRARVVVRSQQPLHKRLFLQNQTGVTS